MVKSQNLPIALNAWGTVRTPKQVTTKPRKTKKGRKTLADKYREQNAIQTAVTMYNTKFQEDMEKLATKLSKEKCDEIRIMFSKSINHYKAALEDATPYEHIRPRPGHEINQYWRQISPMLKEVEHDNMEMHWIFADLAYQIEQAVRELDPDYHKNLAWSIAWHANNERVAAQIRAMQLAEAAKTLESVSETTA